MLTDMRYRLCFFDHVSLKNLKKNPWEEIEKQYKKGDIIKGKVISFSLFGAFVELLPKIRGLCHVSEFASQKEMEESPPSIHLLRAAVLPGKKSLMVGVSGRVSERIAVVTASGRNLPARMYPMEDAMVANIT